MKPMRRPNMRTLRRLVRLRRVVFALIDKLRPAAVVTVWVTGFFLGRLSMQPAYAQAPAATATPTALAQIRVATFTPVPTLPPTSTPEPTFTPTPTVLPTLTAGERNQRSQARCWKRLSSLSVRERWAAIAAGEGGYFWPRGMQLVAWTLQAQHVYWSVPAESMGPGTGWYGCDVEHLAEALPYVDEVWGRAPAEAPFEFMQQGEFCVHLGSYQDVVQWNAQGRYQGPADVVIIWGEFSLNCYFDRMAH